MDENQPGLKIKNLNLILTCNIYKSQKPTNFAGHLAWFHHVLSGRDGDDQSFNLTELDLDIIIKNLLWFSTKQIKLQNIWQIQKLYLSYIAM